MNNTFREKWRSLGCINTHKKIQGYRDSPRALGLWMEAFLYSNDQLPIASSLRAMELMLAFVEQFTAESGIHFSKDPDPAKSKCKSVAINLARPSLLPCCCLVALSLMSPPQLTLDTRSTSLGRS